MDRLSSIHPTGYVIATPPRGRIQANAEQRLSMSAWASGDASYPSSAPRSASVARAARASWGAAGAGIIRPAAMVVLPMPATASRTWSSTLPMYRLTWRSCSPVKRQQRMKWVLVACRAKLAFARGVFGWASGAGASAPWRGCCCWPGAPLPLLPPVSDSVAGGDSRGSYFCIGQRRGAERKINTGTTAYPVNRSLRETPYEYST
mmetsp:Transcript_21977/g.55542  ORF Transcript_21977/g.55542 Transcript_21977/m.55542 type:complete len:205 (-) Transcript_21977:690-1304(-)